MSKIDFEMLDQACSAIEKQKNDCRPVTVQDGEIVAHLECAQRSLWTAIAIAAAHDMCFFNDECQKVSNIKEKK